MNQSIIRISGSKTPTQRIFRKGLAVIAALMLAGPVKAEVPQPAKAPLVYFEVSESGIHRITYEDLAAAGVDLVGVRHARLAVTDNEGRPVAVSTRGMSAMRGLTIRDGGRRFENFFGPGGYIEFVGKEIKTIYTKTNAYALYFDEQSRVSAQIDHAAPPAAGKAVDVYQETARHEEDRYYSTSSSDTDPWFGEELRTGGNRVEKTLGGLQVDHYAPGFGELKIKVDTWGYSDSRHAISLHVGGVEVAKGAFTGRKPFPLTSNLPAGAIREGDNQFTLTLEGESGVYNSIMLDKWELQYPRRTVARNGRLHLEASGVAIEVSGLPGKSVRVYRERPDGALQRLTQLVKSQTGNEWRVRFAGAADKSVYHVAEKGSLLKPRLRLPAERDDLTDGAATYLIVTHPQFMDGNMAQLVQARQAQGYTVKAASVEAVYDAFGHGVFGARAIKDYIAWARVNLGTQMVLLVGGDNYDYHDNLGLGSVSFLPSFYAPTGSTIRVAPVDPKYADIDGDDVPDIAIGRLIPRTRAEWKTIVAKTLAYGQHPNPGSSVFTADTRDEKRVYDFERDAAEMAGRLPPAWQSGVTTAYIDELGLAGARARLLDALQAGQAMVTYVGHSDSLGWTFDGLLRASDAETLANQGAASLVAQWGCWNSFHASPEQDSLTHKFLLQGEQGAVAMLGAATLTAAENNRRLALRFYERLAGPDQPIGRILLEAKRELAANGWRDRDVQLGLALLGDPALIIPQP